MLPEWLLFVRRLVVFIEQMQGLSRFVVVNKIELTAQIYLGEIVLVVGCQHCGPDVFTIFTVGEVRAGTSNVE